MWNAGLDEAQAGIRIVRKNINNHRYADDTNLMAESKQERKSPLIKVKESEKIDLKVNIQKTKIMASGSITSWQIDGETMAGWSTSWNQVCRRNINYLRYADDTTLVAESEEELKSLWWKWKRRVKKLA